MAKSHKIVYTFIVYRDIELLERKIKFLYTAEDYFIVHWNKYSSRRKMRQLQEAFKDYPNVHIYSKIKVVWGTYTILLAMLENMRLALALAGEFEHFVALSEQCAPVKTKEYIKAHLAQYCTKSFCGSFSISTRIKSKGLPYETDAIVLAGYFWGHQGGWRLPFWPRLRSYAYAVADFIYYLVPIMKNAKKTWGNMKKARSYSVLSQSSGRRKFFLGIWYILLFPLRFFIFSLCRSGCVGMYGKLSPLYFRCVTGELRTTKSPGPVSCYCREDVEFLCRPENIKLAKSMKRYFAPEEYFCQTLLYNSETQRKNFLNENLCAADYTMGSREKVLSYLCEQTFKDAMTRDGVPMGYKFSHVCFLRKVADPEVFNEVESRLLGKDKSIIMPL